MVDLIQTTDWDNILKLVMLTMLSDGRVYEREVDTFVNASMNLRSQMRVSGVQTRRMSMDWYIEHRNELKNILTGETFESDLHTLIESLDTLPDKKPLLRCLNTIAGSEQRSGCTDGVIAASRKKWC